MQPFIAGAARWRALGVVGLALFVAGPRLAAGQATLADALGNTAQTGGVTLAVVTSENIPASKGAVFLLVEAAGAGAFGTNARVSEIPAAAHAAYLKKLGVTTAPTVLAYRLGAKGPELAGLKAAPVDAASVSAWLRTLNPPIAARPPMADPAVSRANFHEVAQASPQGSPQAPSAPPVMMVPAAPVQSAPVVSGPPQAPIVVATQAPPIVVQQTPPTIVMGPQQPPNIIFAQTPPAAPNLTIANITPPASAPTANLFINPAPAAPAAPAAPTMMMAAPQPAAPMMMMAAPQPAAPPQNSVIGAAAVGLLLENPALIDRILGAIGKHLARRGLPRVRMNESTPATGFAPVNAATATPATFALPAAPAAPAQPAYIMVPQPTTTPSPQGYEATTPSPQSGYATQPHKKFRLFGH